MSGCYITGWAYEVNYPVGANPWNGQPMKIAPVSDYLMPGTPAVVEYLNWKLNELSTAVQALQVSSYVPALQNWGPQESIVGVGTQGVVAGCWDPLSGQWYLCFGDQIGAGLDVSYTKGLDGDTQAFSGGTPTVLTAAAWTALPAIAPGQTLTGTVSMAPDPTTAGHVWLCASVIGGTVVRQWNGAAWVVQHTFSTGHYVTLHTYNGNVIIALGGSGVSSLGICNAASGTVLQSTSGTNVGPMLLCDNTGNAGPANMIVAVGQQTACASFWTSIDGVTWTARTFSFLGSTQQIGGLVWTTDVVGPCFLLAVFDTSSLLSSFYRSADGIVWTLSSTNHATTVGIAGMAAIGSSVYVTYGDASSAGPSAAAYSPNGGVAWYASQAILSSNNASGAGYYLTGRQVLAAPGIGFFTFNSLWFRFSQAIGLPAVLT